MISMTYVYPQNLRNNAQDESSVQASVTSHDPFTIVALEDDRIGHRCVALVALHDPIHVTWHVVSTDEALETV